MNRKHVASWALDTGKKALALFLVFGTVSLPLGPYATARAQDLPVVASSGSFEGEHIDSSALDPASVEVSGLADLSDTSDSPLLELSPEARDAISGTALEEAVESGAIDPATLEGLVGEGEGEPEVVPVSLPGGETRDTVSSSAISLPDAEGSVEGMGESFSPILSSGTGTFSVPIAVAPGRAGVQPSLSLAYSSAGGNSSVGFGWGLGGRTKGLRIRQPPLGSSPAETYFFLGPAPPAQ